MVRNSGDLMNRIVVRDGSEPSKMFPLENAIYEIRYCLDLRGETVKVPDGCVLSFDGGRLTNGSIQLNGAAISAAYDGAFYRVEVSGAISNREICASWFKYEEGHDDFGLLKCLCENSGRVRLCGMEFNADKSMHPGDWINVRSDTVIDGEGAVVNANHSAGGWDSLFDVAHAYNVEFKNFSVNCELGVSVDPPIDHDCGKILTSGVYAISVNDWCSGLRISNVRFNRVGYALKTTRHAAYTGTPHFEDIVVDGCYAYADMPLQGAGFANFRCVGSTLISRGTNSGNHAVYMLPITDPAYEGPNRGMLFDGCFLKSEDGDGHVVQIYASGDDGEKSMNKCHFTNCVIASAGCTAITCSQSADLYLRNCDLRSESGSNCSPGGNIYFRQCSIKNYVFYGNVSIKDSRIETSAPMLITGADGAAGDIELINDAVVCAGYFIYNNTDSMHITVKRCDISVSGDGVISQRKGQTAPLTFENCKIRMKSRLCYCPGKSAANTFTFVMCDMASSNPSYFFTTNSDDYVELEFQTCLLDGDLLHSPKAQINAGANRPAGAVRVGQTFFDTALGKMIVWNGAAWVNMDGTALE